MNIENINLENTFITAKLGAELSESKNINFKNVTVIPSKGVAFKLNNVTNFTSENVTSLQENTADIFEISGYKTSGIMLKGVSENIVKIHSDVNKEEIKLN